MRTLFKYSSIDGALGILNDRGVKLTNPVFFNDVFDCRFEPNKQQNIEGFKYYTKFMFFRHALECIRKGDLIPPNKKILFSKEYNEFLIELRKTNIFEFDAFMEPVIALAKQKYKNRFKKTQKWFDDVVDTAVKHAKENALVACFSKNKNSLLMWSHYADSHKGVCLEFEYDSKYFYDVIYDEKVAEFDVMAGLQAALASAILGKKEYDQLSLDLTLKPFYTKSIEWKYEEEVRGVFHAKESPDVAISVDASHYYLPMPKPKRIYIGCRAFNTEDPILMKKLNRLLFRANRLRIDVVFLKQSQNEYKLIPDEKEYSISNDRSISASLLELIAEMNNCLNKNNHLAALSISFIIMSLCSKIYRPNDDEKAQFVAWCEDYLIANHINPESKRNDSNYLNTQYIWDLKERFQKYGDFNIKGQYGDFRLDYIKVEKEKSKFLNLISDIKNKNSIFADRNYVTFNILEFCSEIELLAKSFYKVNKEAFDKMIETNIEDKDIKREDLLDCVPWEFE